ncbi:prepilin-type N-terminal cleavage/methylation domain-containing protein [Chitinivorax sp. B]|uniref:prepilin-type N-terminal cleavage/methylation domain-containing protein n=1 Tax=Chitinivorax sp. B TaxID=2502235 RepID=UPI0010F5F26B|nr:prepilin-type N-terminal cleavage/methylation domain-containing protein [Chitinivorax sp. B]
MKSRPIYSETPGASCGFSLVELVVVLLVLGLIMAGVMGPLSAQQEARRVNESRLTLDAALEALAGYAMANGGLPCPAVGTIATGSNGAGVAPANCVFGPGSVAVGVLPWVTLGLPENDAWGHRMTYAIALDFDAQASKTPKFTLNSTGRIDVYTRLPQINTNRQVLGAPMLILSHGKRGQGAFMSDGSQIAAGTDPRVIENADGDRSFVSQTTADDDFDHIIRWMATPTLMAKMVQAGKLP